MQEQQTDGFLNEDEKSQETAEVPAAAQQPAAQPPQSLPEAAQSSGAVLKWLKVLSVLFALSIVSALVVIIKGGVRNTAAVDSGGKLSSMIAQKGRDGIAWIPVRGVITTSRSDSPFEKGTGNVARTVRNMADKSNVKAIVLDINTPGGSVGAVQEIYDAVLYAKNTKKKPIVAMFRDVSASGGYYISAPADIIIAQPGTITGSIGVIFSLGNFKGLFEKIGVRMEAIKSGKFKDMGSPYRDLTTEERDMIQSIVADSYEQFYTAVKDGRRLPDEKLANLCDGRIFTGRQALANGLVDQLGGETEARKAAGKLADLGDNPKILRSQDTWENVRDIFNAETRSPAADALKTFTDFASPSAAYLWVY